MSRMSETAISRPSSFPRVSGDEPDELRKMVSEGKFSPRERG